MFSLFTNKNFSTKTKLRLIKSASICQMCSMKNYYGNCAHIVASGKNGPRNKNKLVSEGIITNDYVVDSFENGLYLCANCHAKIDNNPEIYTYDYLVNLKKNSCTQVLPHEDHNLPYVSTESVVNDVNNNNDVINVVDDNPLHTRKSKFFCSSCEKTFSRKTTLEYHISNKVCQKPRSKICPHCHKEFTTKQMCQYHISHNVCGNHVVKSEHDEINKEEIIIKPSKLEDKHKTQQPIIPPAFLTIDNYQQTMKYTPNLLHEALSKHPENFITYLIKETNCNPNMPMYNSVKYTDKKSSFLRVSDGEKYVYASKNDTIAKLIENKRDMLQKYVGDNGSKYEAKILDKYQTYIDILDDDKESKKALEIDIICMLLNVSDVIGSDDWSKKLLEDLKKWEGDLLPKN